MLKESNKVTLLQNKALLSTDGEGDRQDLHLLKALPLTVTSEFIITISQIFGYLAWFELFPNTPPARKELMAGKCYICGLYGRTSIHHRGLQDRVWKRGTCAKAERNLCLALRSSAPSPPAQSTDGRSADSASRRLFTPSGKKGRRKGQDVLHVAQRGLSKVRGIGLGSGLDARQPKKARAGPGRDEPRPPHAARPAAAPGTLPELRAPLTAHARPRRRAREPGPLLLPHALGAERDGRPGPGASSGGGRGGRAGGRRRASSPVAAETPWEPKVWQSEGRGPGGGGGPRPALLRLSPLHSARLFPRESAPHRRGTDRRSGLFRCPSAWDWSSGVRAASRRRWHSLKDP